MNLNTIKDIWDSLVDSKRPTIPALKEIIDSDNNWYEFIFRKKYEFRELNKLLYGNFTLVVGLNRSYKWKIQKILIDSKENDIHTAELLAKKLFLEFENYILGDDINESSK